MSRTSVGVRACLDIASQPLAVIHGALDRSVPKNTAMYTSK
jgi:hypothetical protein